MQKYQSEYLPRIQKQKRLKSYLDYLQTEKICLEYKAQADIQFVLKNSIQIVLEIVLYLDNIRTSLVSTSY